MKSHKLKISNPATAKDKLITTATTLEVKRKKSSESKSLIYNKFENKNTQKSNLLIPKRKKNAKKNINKFAKIQDSEISSTSLGSLNVNDAAYTIKEDPSFKLSSLWIGYRPLFSTLVRAGSDWYSQLIKEKIMEDQINLEESKILRDLASRIFADEVFNYNKAEESGNKRNDVHFRKTILSHGTARDKIAANVLRCMEAPVHSLSHLNSLIAYVSPKSKREFSEALVALQELFEGTLLPNSLYAQKFELHSFLCLTPFCITNRQLAEKQLILWYFEDQLQEAYERLIRQLSKVARDTIEKNKLKAIAGLLNLLSNHPKQNCELILETLINKLGDPLRKVAAHTMYGLRKLLIKRPELKLQVVTLVEIFLYRQNVQDKAQYYGLCFLKDMIFSKNEMNLATKLLKIYFGFFKACTKKGEVDTRLMAVLLRGINRAFPYAAVADSNMEEQLDTLYKICHMVNFTIATQALQLIYQVVDRNQNTSDRFYQVLYRQIQDPSFGTSSANSAFLNLVYKALRKDECLQRVHSFIKRLIQVCQYQSSHVVCGILYLVSEIIKGKPNLDVIGTSSLGLNDEDEEEFYPDLELDVEENVTLVSVNSSVDNIVPEDCKPSWLHKMYPSTENQTTVYNPFHRNPLYSGAQHSHLWELKQLQDHFHPSVALFSTQILSKEKVTYSGDPLHDFTLMRFLDRFVYRNPKKQVRLEDNAGGGILGRKSQYMPHGVRGLQVNTREFWSLPVNKIPEDEQFYHKYFTAHNATLGKKIKEEDWDDSESISDDEFDNYMANMKGVDSDDELDNYLDFASGATKCKADDLELESEDEDNDEINDHMTKSVKKEDFPNGEDSNNENEEEDSLLDQNSFGSEDESDEEFDEEMAEFSDDEFKLGSKIKKKGKKSSMSLVSQKLGKKSSRNKKYSMEGMFASADDFAHILEENAEEAGSNITSHALSNKDKSSLKQLNWEVDRDRFVKESDNCKKMGRDGFVKGSDKRKRKQKKGNKDDKRGNGFKKFKSNNKYKKN